MRLKLSLFCSLVALTACSDIPREAFLEGGAPENLLDLSTETVNVALTSPNSVNELVDWVNREQPSRAELHCSGQTMMCMRAQDVFAQFAVPVESVQTAGQDEAVLIYERVSARDCDQRYVDNTINPYNMHYPTYGCSISANMVQMVSDKRQFINPSLLDFADAERARRNVRDYAVGAKPQGQNGQGLESLLSSVATSSSR